MDNRGAAHRSPNSRLFHLCVLLCCHNIITPSILVMFTNKHKIVTKDNHSCVANVMVHFGTKVAPQCKYTQRYCVLFYKLHLQVRDNDTVI
jgi:hypothetical protein